jgi:hypothetical protein
MPDKTEKSFAEGFNLTIAEVRLVSRFRSLSPHQQRGILQAMELIRPGKAPIVRNATPRQ